MADFVNSKIGETRIGWPGYELDLLLDPWLIKYDDESIYSDDAFVREYLIAPFSLGHVQASRAVPYVRPDEETVFTETGYHFCLTEVIDWPWTEDLNGVPFPAGLKGVRTVTLRTFLSWDDVEYENGDGPGWRGDGDSDEEWVAVPGQLPEGYTAMNRGYGMLTKGFYANYLAQGHDDTTVPFNTHVIVANIRTPTGLLYDTSTYHSEDWWRSRWYPMNRTQQTYGGLTRSRALAETFGDDHVGFRGGIGTLTLNNPLTVPAEPPENVTATVVFKSEPVTGGATVTYATLNYNHTFSSYTDPDYQIDVSADVPEMMPDPGLRHYFWCEVTISPTHTGGLSLDMSPRVDVPLWYSASTGNLVAPGGIPTESL